MREAAAVVTVHVPMRLKRRGGRKRIEAPDGVPLPERTPEPDGALVKALARAFRWRRMLESGDHASITDLARAEKISRSYLTTMLRLTFLAPEVVEAIVDGRQGRDAKLEALMEGVPIEWGKHAEILGAARGD
ncbi:MAG: hypothetical protein AAGF76_00940 [Pseudomonadota bacterium]